MQYQSIIRLFDYCNIDCDTMDLGKIRKILAAEFSIADGGIISVEGFDYTKNDIFQELENPDFPQRLKYHQCIWENKNLLECLEKNTVKFQYLYTWIDLREDSGFVSFVSPYYAESFDKIMRKFLHPVDFEDAWKWLRLFSFTDNAADEDKALSGVRAFVSDFIRSLNNSNSVTYVGIIKELENWIDQPSDSFVNYFPDSLYKLKDDLIRAMVNFTVAIQHENKNLCYEISRILVNLTGLDSNLRELIRENHKIYASKAGHGPKSERSGGFNGWAMVPVIIIIIRIVSTCASHSSFDRNSLKNQMNERKKVSTEYYNKLRSQYAVIDTTHFSGNLDQNELIIDNAPYYMMFERSDSTAHVTVNIVNNGTMSITIYLNTDDGIVMDLKIDPHESLKISRNKSAFDMLLSNSGESRITFQPSPILISDSLNLKTHPFRLQSGKGIINIDYTDPSQEDAFVMTVYSKPLNGMNLNYFTFSKAHWID